MTKKSVFVFLSYRTNRGTQGYKILKNGRRPISSLQEKLRDGLLHRFFPAKQGKVVKNAPFCKHSSQIIVKMLQKSYKLTFSF